MDIEFIDIINPSLNGMPISDWRKFKVRFLEFGIDYNKMVEDEFNRIFTDENVDKILK
jgi:hypothetical protein